jgi:hypothetical protein
MRVVEWIFGGLIALGIVNVLTQQNRNTAGVITATGNAGSNVFGTLTKSS